MCMCSLAIYNTTLAVYNLTIPVCAAPIQESQAVYHTALAVSAAPKLTRASNVV